MNYYQSNWYFLQLTVAFLTVEFAFVIPSTQDMSFFDEETVGDLTSRLGADCQQVSQVIGLDLNMICRNILQVYALA